MKKFIDKESGRIISILNVDEAKKVLKMYINYCLGKQEVKKSRLGLVDYLGDFINYSDKKDIAKFYDVLVKEKDGYEFSKSDAKAYDSLISFFELYSNIENGAFELSNVSNYITSAVEKKENIEKKVENNEELNFEEKLNNIFFNKGFDLTILAKHACEKYEESLKEKISQSEGGVDVSLQEELAYQDLKDLCDQSNIEEILAVEENETKEEVKDEPEVSEEKKPDEEPTEVATEEASEETVEETPEETKETTAEEPAPQTAENDNVQPKKQNFGIEDNNITWEENEKSDKKDPVNEDENIASKNDKSEDEVIIQPQDVRDATQDVSLRDAADFFNGALDGFADTKKGNKDEDSSGTFGGTLRDR